MQLLTPGFLFGLVAIALPVLLHLVRRPEPIGSPFPSLMFLRKIPFRSRRRKRLRDLLLLAIRCIALALLALAFAGPHLSETDTLAAEPVHPLDRVYLLDNSYSMAYPGQWTAAQRALRLHLETLAPGERAATMTFDHAVRLQQDLTDDPDRLSNSMDGLRPGSGATDYAAALDGAARLLEDSNANRQQVILISDLQRNGMHRSQPPTLAERMELEVVPLPIPDGSNPVIMSAQLVPGSATSQHTLVLRLRNTGTTSATGVRVFTVLEGRETEAGVLDLEPGSGHTLQVPVVLPNDRTVRLAVRIGSAEGPTDNAFYLVSAREQKTAVLLVTSVLRESLFLQQALALANSPAFEVALLTADELDPSALSEVDVVVLDDIAIPGGPTGEALAGFVAGGGGLLVVAAAEATGFWPDGGGGYLPGPPGNVVELTPQNARLFAERTARQLPEALYETLAAAFSDVETYRYREIGIRGGDQVLARFGDGAPALVNRDYGDGRVLVATTTLDPRWSALAASPGFAPFTIELVRFLAGRTAGISGLQVGTRFNFDHRAGSLPEGLTLQRYLAQGQGVVVETPDGDSVRLRPGAASYAPEIPGFYEFHPADGSGDAVPVAVNVDRAESNLATVEEAVFLDSIIRPAVVQPQDAAGMPGAGVSQERGWLWWTVLVLAGLALLADAWFANHLAARGEAVPTSGVPARNPTG